MTSEEEESSHANLLDVQTNKHVLNSLGEEQSSRITRSRLIHLPKEEILPDEIEQTKGNKGEAVDDGRNHHVSKRNDNKECDSREERAKEDVSEVVFDGEDGTRRRAEDEELDIVDDEWDGLEETTGRSRECLKDSIGQEESGRHGQVCGEYVGDARGIFTKGRKSVDDRSGDGDDEETVYDFKDEEAGHEAEFDTSLTGDTLELTKDCIIY